MTYVITAIVASLATWLFACWFFGEDDVNIYYEED